MIVVAIRSSENSTFRFAKFFIEMTMRKLTGNPAETSAIPSGSNSGFQSVRMKLPRSKKRTVARRLLAAMLLSAVTVSPALAQQPPKTSPPPSNNKSPAGTTDSTSRKLSDKERKQEKARELFADAANAQNNGAFPLAIELWNKLLKDYSADPLASSAHHFLGICYLQQESPDYPAAIAQFKLAIQDANLKQREETLVNLGWCLYQQSLNVDGAAKKEMLQEASKVLTAFLDKYPDGSFADKAMFYAAESESRLGNSDRAIQLYSQLIQSRSFENSSVRPDALFALAITFDDVKQLKLAKENYDAFLAKHPDHPLAREARIRSAEISIKSDQAEQAIALLKPVIESKDFTKIPNADYALYRYGFALAKAGKFKESAEAYSKLSSLFPKSQYSENSALAAGQTLLRDKKYDEAKSVFERLLPAKDERAAEAAHWICQIAILKGKSVDAVPVAESALQWAGKTNFATLLKMDLADGLSGTADGRTKAKTLYEQIAVENPDSTIAPRATYNAAFASLQLGNLADAQRWAEAFAKRFANDPLASDVAYIRAEATLQLGQFESAATAFEQLLASDRDNPLRMSWQMRLATARYLGGQFDQAIAQATEVLKAEKDPIARAEALFLQGASLLKLQKNELAIDKLKDSVKENGKWAQADEVLLLLAEAQSLEGLKAEAKATLERILSEFPQSRFKQQVEFRLGQLSANVGDFDRAMLAYDAVLKTSSDKSLVDYAAYGKAFILIQREQFAAALVLLDPIALPSRNDSVGQEARIAKAICLRQTGKATEAVSVLSQLLSTTLSKEQKQKATYELGLSQAATENFDATIQTFEGLIASSDRFPLLDKAYYELGWAYKSKGNTEKANDVFQSLASKFPDSPLTAEAYFHVGQAEYESSKYDRAIKAYTVAATRSVDSTLQEKSLYKLGWAFFQQRDFAKASENFNKQIREFPKGSLIVDARFMVAECALKRENYVEAWPLYELARRTLEASDENTVSAQVRALILLHGAQAARELKRWKDVESWIGTLTSIAPDSTHAAIAKYELAYAKQNQKKPNEALVLYSEVAEEERNEIGARSRFMMGEVLFADREFAKAVSEFQKVMYGYGGTQAPTEIKNWQARAAFEAGRCSEVLISDLSGDRRKKAIDIARKFYEFVVANHETHELAQQAADRIKELSRG